MPTLLTVMLTRAAIEARCRAHSSPPAAPGPGLAERRGARGRAGGGEGAAR